MSTIIASNSNRDIMLLLNSSPEIAPIVFDMTKAKRLYVDERHKHDIFILSSKNKYRDGHFATHIYENNKRKLVDRATEEQLYDFLFNFYRKQDEHPKTLNEAFELFLDNKRAKGLSESTIKEYIRYNGFISKRLKEMSLSSITEEDLRSWIMDDFIKRKPKKECLKKMIQLIKAVFALGLRKKYCFEDPTLDILSEDYYKYCNLDCKSNEEKSFSDQELDRIREYCLQHIDNPHAVAVMLSAETGVRAGELVSIRKSDLRDGFIHIHRQQIRVPKTKDNPLCFKEVEYTKNERMNPRGGRIVPITQKCQEAINIALALSGESEYLLHHPDGNWLLKDSYEAYLRRICSRLGIQTSNNHAFRVAYNGRLLDANIDARDRCLVLGHSIQTNERNYSFSDLRNAERVKKTLNLNSGKSA